MPKNTLRPRESKDRVGVRNSSDVMRIATATQLTSIAFNTSVACEELAKELKDIKARLDKLAKAFGPHK